MPTDLNTPILALLPTFIVACGLLVVAGAAKLRTPAPAQDSLALVGARVPRFAVRALGAAELVVGVIAVISPGRVSAGIVAAAYGAFCVFIAVLLRVEERPTDCGCFGAAGTGAGRSHLLLCAAGCVVGTLAAISPPPGIAWVFGRAPLVAVPLVAGIATATFAAYLAFTVFPKAWRAYGSEVPS